jgi:hypothetical protein
MTDETRAVWDFLDDDALTTPPIKSERHPDGQVYVIPSPTAEAGLRYAALTDLGTKAARGVKIEQSDLDALQLNDQQERHFMRDLLSPAVYDQMLEDGVSWVRMQRLSQYAFIYFTQGERAANDFAAAGGFSGGKVLTPGQLNRQQRRTPQDRQGSAGSSPRRARRRR